MADPIVAPPVAAVAPPTAAAEPGIGGPPTDPKAIVTTELGGEPPKSEPKLGPDGKPLPEQAAPAAFDPAKLTLPEGMKSDDPFFKTYFEVMSDDKLAPQERGQKLIDLYHGALKQVGEANTEAWKTVNANWVKEVKADPEIGGAKFDQTKATIARAIDSIGPEKAAAFRQALDVTGIGNHPAFWRGMAAMAARLTEGGHVAGSPAGGGKSDVRPADFFPNSKMNG